MMSTESSPPDGCHAYTDASQVPKQLRNYWAQRYDLFSDYDSGIWLTDNGWYEVTPECIAVKIADHIAATAPRSKTVIIDAFAGHGSNAIAFALSDRWSQIFAIEKDPAAMECAKHNAEIYGVKNKIFWLQGDCFDIIKKRFGRTGKNAVIFGSPPWGGPSYSHQTTFDLSLMQPYNIADLYNSFSKVTSTVVLYLPRSSNIQQLADMANDEQAIYARHYCIGGFSKALCVFYGDFAMT